MLIKHGDGKIDAIILEGEDQVDPEKTAKDLEKVKKDINKSESNLKDVQSN